MAASIPSYYPAPLIVNRTGPGNMSRQRTPEARIYTDYSTIDRFGLRIGVRDFP